MTIRQFKTELWLPRSITEVFAFFSDVANLDVLTPPWLHFRILPPAVALHQGSLIEYRLRWRGIPLSWRTEIAAWEPPVRFVDRQVKGPYRQWVHEHTFEERDGGTLMRDVVDYAVSGWLLEPLINRLVVAPDIARIFAYRRQKMEELFARPASR